MRRNDFRARVEEQFEIRRPLSAPPTSFFRGRGWAVFDEISYFWYRESIVKANSAIGPASVETNVRGEALRRSFTTFLSKERGAVLLAAARESKSVSETNQRFLSSIVCTRKASVSP